MINLINLSKAFRYKNHSKIVADKITVRFPSKTTVALLGRNGAGKSSILGMIAGTIKPDHGRVVSNGSISWPVGFAGSFHPDLTGLQNTKFIARVYGIDTESLETAAQNFACLGQHFFQPVRNYSSGMRSRLAFGISMSVDFDTYLVDEVMSVGDADFKERSLQVFKDRMRDRAGIVVTHSMPIIKEICEHGAVLENGKITYYKNIDHALQHHLEVIKTDQTRFAQSH